MEGEQRLCSKQRPMSTFPQRFVVPNQLKNTHITRLVQRMPYLPVALRVTLRLLL